MAASSSTIVGTSSSAIEGTSSCAQRTRNVVIITFGTGNKLINELDEMVSRSNDVWDCVDLRTELDDPLAGYQVYHGEDSRYYETVAAVHAQPKFPIFVRDMVHRLDSNIIDTDSNALSCKTGHHRADCSGEAVTSVLNSLRNGDGSRPFNACHLPLHRVTSRSVLHERLQQAREWVSQPWTTMEPYRFGENECKNDKNAFDGFNQIWDFVQLINDYHKYNFESRHPKEAPAAELSPASASPTHRRKTKRASFRLTPRSPSDPPPRVAPSILKRMPVTPDRSAFPPWKKKKTWKTVMDNAMEEWEVVGPVPLADAWSSALKEWNVDEAARKGLFLLSQRSPWGFEMANDIVSKLIKKQADDETLRKPSAFVHTACKNARESMMTW